MTPTNLQLIEQFITHILSIKRYSPLTARNYRHDLEEFLRWGELSSGGDFELLQVKGEDLRRWMMTLSEEGKMKSASINRTLSSLRSFYRYLRHESLVEKNPFVGVSSMRTSRRLPKYVAEEQMVYVVERVLQDAESEDYIEARNALVVLLFYASGLRLAELVGLNVGDFASDFSMLKVRGKGDKERVVPIVKRLREIIIRYISRFLAHKIWNSPQKPLFLSKRGERISRSDVQRTVARLLRECGVEGKSSPHVLRHTFATHLLNEGADLREIQELLGHSSLRATQVYTHNNIAQLRRIYSEAHPRSAEEEVE